MNLVIDTNALSDFFKEASDVVLSIKNSSKIYVPVTVIGEYKYGIYGGSRKKNNLNLLSKFLAKPNVIILEINDETAEQYARLRAYLRVNGTPIPVNDLWIAALCAQHDLPLLTRDGDFKHLPQVHLI